MSDQYAHWDDGPYQQPPRPPRRPSYGEWIAMSELSRQAYEAGITAYLQAVSDVNWWNRLCQMSIFYQTWLWTRGVQDANWKRGAA